MSPNDDRGIIDRFTQPRPLKKLGPSHLKQGTFSPRDRVRNMELDALNKYLEATQDI